jgi:hypothetical protein
MRFFRIWFKSFVPDVESSKYKHLTSSSATIISTEGGGVVKNLRKVGVVHLGFPPRLVFQGAEVANSVVHVFLSPVAKYYPTG